MIEILTQPKWAFWRYKEAYRFQTHLPTELARDRIRDFFISRSTRNLLVSENTVQFIRGSLLGSIFSWIERHHKQEVQIDIEDWAKGARVTCRYHCFDPYPNLHIAPRVLQLEVEKLEEFVAHTTERTNTEPSPAGDSLKAAPEEQR
jgi:hypothetical protein